MKKFGEQVLAPHKHMSKKASPYHAHSQGLVYTPKGKEEIRPIDTADAGYGGEAVADGQGGEADPGRASKKAVAPMKMQTLVKKTNEGFDSSPADIAKMLVAKHGKNITKDHIKALEQDRDSHSGLDHDEIMKHVKKLQEETERERLMKLRSFAFKNREKGLGKAMVEEEEINEMDKSQPAAGRDSNTPFPKPKPIKLTDKQSASAKLMTRELLNQAKKQLKKEEVDQIDELKKSTLASYAKKATDDVSYHSFTAGTMSAKDPERLAQDKKAMKRQSGVIKAIDRLAKEEVELDERNMENKAKKDNVVRQVGTHAYIKHGTDAGSPKMTGRKVMKDPKIKSSKVADMYRKLPSMEEATNVTDYNPKSQGGTRVELLRKLAKSKSPEHATAARKAGATQHELKKAMTAEEYQVVAHAKTGEKFKSGLYPTKEKAQSMHYKLAKSGKHKNIKLVKVSEANDWNGPAEENDMALTQLHFIHYAAEEIIAAVEAGTDMEEWYQNKLSKLHGDMESLYSYMQGRQRFTGTLGDPMTEAKADVRVSVHKDIQDFLKKGGKVKQLPPSKATHRPGTALASKMIGSKGQVPGLARNVGGKKPVVAVEEGKMKDIATDKDEEKRLAAHAADMLGGPVKKKPEGPKGKLPLGFRLARSAAKKAMKSVSEKKTSKVPRVGELEMTLEEYADI